MNDVLVLAAAVGAQDEDGIETCLESWSMSQKLWEMISLGSLYRLWMLRSGSCIAACNRPMFGIQLLADVGIARWPTSPTFPGRLGNLQDMHRRPRDWYSIGDLIWFRSLRASHTILERYPLKSPAPLRCGCMDNQCGWLYSLNLCGLWTFYFNAVW